MIEKTMEKILKPWTLGYMDSLWQMISSKIPDPKGLAGFSAIDYLESQTLRVSQAPRQAITENPRP
jgi:hypothetical protein